MSTTRLVVPTELLLMSRTIGDLPASGCLSRVTVMVTCVAFPAVVTDGLPASARLRSLAIAAGAMTSAASAARTTSLRMFSSFGLPQLHPPTASGSAARGIGTAGEDADAGAVQLEQHRRCVVGVGALAQHAFRVRPMDEDVSTGRQACHIDRLALLRRDVVVAEAGGD